MVVNDLVIYVFLSVCVCVRLEVKVMTKTNMKEKKINKKNENNVRMVFDLIWAN